MWLTDYMSGIEQPSRDVDRIFGSLYKAISKRHLFKESILIIYIHYRLKVKRYSSPEQVISELRSITCHMKSHSVTCHTIQVNTPRLNHSLTA